MRLHVQGLAFCVSTHAHQMQLKEVFWQTIFAMNWMWKKPVIFLLMIFTCWQMNVFVDLSAG